MLSYGLLVLFSDRLFAPKEMIISMMFTKNWFVVAYMMLLLVSPMIEKSLDGISSKQLLYWLMLLTVFNLYFGFYLGKVNDNGYNVVHFVWLYYIGRYFRMSKDNCWNLLMQKNVFWIYTGSALAIAFIFIFMSKIGHPIATIKWFAYNNPLLMLSSIGLFLWISQLTVKSRLINILATCVFGVFLLHTTPYVIPLRNEITSIVYKQFGYSGIFVEVLILFVALCVITIGINKCNESITSSLLKKVNSHRR